MYAVGWEIKQLQPVLIVAFSPKGFEFWHKTSVMLGRCTAQEYVYRMCCHVDRGLYHWGKNQFFAQAYADFAAYLRSTYPDLWRKAIGSRKYPF